MKISGIVITKNEENNIGGCLESIKWCNEIPFSKTEFVYFTKLFVMFLSFTAIADIILTLFSLLKSIWKM